MSNLQHRNSIVEIDDRDGGTRRIIQSPYRFSESTSEVRGPAPLRGEHNRDVLGDWLGLQDDDVDQWCNAGVLLSEG